MKSSKLKIISAALLLTLIFFFINGPLSQIRGESKKPLRALIDKKKLEEKCEEARETLKSKYKSGNFDKNLIKKDDYDKEIINFVRTNEYGELKGYLKYLTLRFILIIVLDILFIFGWICYCSCCCNPCCCCKGKKGEAGCFGKLSYIFANLFALGVLACSIIGFVFAGAIHEDIKGAECSAYKMIYHFKEGYEEGNTEFPKWKGITNITIMIENASNRLGNIKTFENDASDVSFSEGIWFNASEVYKNGFQYANTIETGGLKSAVNDAKSFINQFDNIEEKYINEGFKYLDDYIDEYRKLSNIVLFGLSLVLAFVSLICFSIYVNTCKCVKCIYVIIWNIETLFMLVIILVGVAFGMVGVFGNDLVYLVQYTLSEENLNSSKPIILQKDNKVSLDYINVCLNQDGNIGNEIKMKENLKGLDDLYLLKSEVNIYLKLNPDENIPDQKKLIEGLKELNYKIGNITEIFGQDSDSTIFNFTNCSFLRSDVNIFLNEVKDNLFKTSSKLSLIIIIIGLALGMSIFFGIIVMNRYKDVEDKKKKKVKSKNEDTQPEIKSSEDSEVSSKEKIKKHK